jgi:hypothetical protein
MIIVPPRLQRLTTITRSGAVLSAPTNPLLHRLTPTAINVSDGATPTYTLATTPAGVHISATNFNKKLLFSTGVYPFGKPVARLTLTVRVTALGAPGFAVGMAFRDGGGNYLALTWQAVGRLGQNLNGTLSNLRVDLPTVTVGDELTMQFDTTEDGEVGMTCQKNGGIRQRVRVTGAPIGQAYIYWDEGAAGPAADVVLTEQSVTAYTETWSPIGTAIAPAGWAERIPAGLTLARFPVGTRFWADPTDDTLFYTNADLSRPMLSVADPRNFVQYVDLAAGDDTHAGTTTAPLKSLRQAKLNAGVGTRAIILAKSGVYDYANSFGSGSPAGKMLQIESWDGEPVISSMHQAGLVWTIESGSTYQATFTDEVVNVADALNLTADGDYTLLTLAASLVACRATAGSYFVSGTTIYVHTSDGRLPAGETIRVYKRAADGSTDFNAHFSGPDAVYIGKLIGFEGGESAYWMDTNGAPLTDQQNVYAYRAWFKYSGPNLGAAPWTPARSTWCSTR